MMRNRARALVVVMSSGGPSDTTAPTVAITSTETSPTFAATIPLTITFSEEVTGFVVGGITVAGCTLSDFATADNIVFTVTATPTAALVTVDIAEGVAIDAAGNENTAATQFSIVAMGSFSLLLYADDITGNDGDEVVSWVSRINAAHDFVQATATQKPLLKKGANGINNHNVLRFDGNDTLRLAGSQLFNDSQGSLIVVVRFNGSMPETRGMIVSSCDEGTGNFFWGLYADGYEPTAPSNHVIRSHQRNNDLSDSVYGNTVLSADTVYVMVLRSNGSAYSMRVNGVEQTLTAGGGANNGDWLADTTLRDSVAIGCLQRSTQATFFIGDVAEINYTAEYIDGVTLSAVEASIAARNGT